MVVFRRYALCLKETGKITCGQNKELPILKNCWQVQCAPFGGQFFPGPALPKRYQSGSSWQTIEPTGASFSQEGLLNDMGTSTSRKVELMYFSLFLPLSTNKNHSHYIYSNHKKILKVGEKKADGLGTKEWHGGKFSEFSFCLIYLRMGAEETCNQEM